MLKGILLDTIFFIRLLDKTDKLHENSKGYFKFFLQNEFELMISTISIAEYCIGGNVDELPINKLQIVPFNFEHLLKTAEFAKVVFRNRKNLNLKERNIIPNDTKLFAQADIQKNVEFYLSSDTESFKIYKFLQQHIPPRFQFIDLNVSYSQTFGILDL